jgi:methyl-accepting chemotaxis protein
MGDWFGRVSVKGKIYLAVIPLVVFLIGASAAGFATLIQAVKQEKQVGAFAEATFRTFSDLGENFLLARVYLRDHLTFTERGDAALARDTGEKFWRYAKQMQTSMDTIEDKLAKAEEIGFREAAGIERLRADFDAFVNVAVTIHGHIKNGNFEQAKTDIGTDCHVTAGAFLESMGSMKEASSNFFTGVSNQVSTTLGKLYWAAGAALVVAMIGLLLLSRLMQAYVVKPLRAASARMHDIADGEGDLTQRLEESGDDELAQLARAFNKFVGKTQQLMREISGSVEQLSTAAAQLAATSEQSSGNVRSQRSETDQVAVAINQMAATTQEVARSIADAATAADGASRKASDGAALSTEAVTAIGVLHQQLNEAVGVIDTVAAESDRIKTVLEVIREISEQTNLLALNAAIEAARAGEMGRGFAVVADEVRNLANRTQTSAGEIDEMIAHLTDQVGAAVKVMQAAGEKADFSEDRVQSAASALDEIAGAVRALNDLNTQIASAAEEQTSGVEEINRNVANISHAVQQTASGAEQTAGASEGLAQLATGLQTMVGRFKV